MEIKNIKNVLVDLQVWLGYERVYTVGARVLSGGLALFWEKSVNMDVLYADKNVLDCHIQFGSFVFSRTCVYGDPILKESHKMGERITRFGDFNDLLHNGEKTGGPARASDSFEDFGNMIKGCGMIELPSHGNAFTWGGWRHSLYTQSKLDRCFGNKLWYMMFPVANQKFLEMRGSDHRPVLISFVASQDS